MPLRAKKILYTGMPHGEAMGIPVYNTIEIVMTLVPKG
jgi:hypothetical protein